MVSVTTIISEIQLLYPASLAERQTLEPQDIHKVDRECLGISRRMYGYNKRVRSYSANDAETIIQHWGSHGHRGRRHYCSSRSSWPTTVVDHAPNPSRQTTTAHIEERPRITIGADPEFEIWYGNETRNAGGILGGTSVPVGSDVGGKQGELRPKYGTPKVCFNSLNTLLNEAFYKLTNHFNNENFVIVAGEGKKWDTGGHIHIGGAGNTLTSAQLATLDKFIYRPIKSICNGVRKNGNYDKASAIRTQPHGVEYRSAPSWLAHPIVTNGVLNAANTIMLSRRLPESEQEIIDEANDIDARMAIESYFTLINHMKRERTRLEDLDVMQTWGIKRPQVTRESNNELITEVEISNDEFMPQQPIYTTAGFGYKFVGAAANRGLHTIYLPRSLNDLFNPLSQLQILGLREQVVSVTCTQWDHRNMIGIGRNARERLGVRGVKTLIEKTIEIIQNNVARYGQTCVV